MKVVGLTKAKDKLSSVIENAKNNPTSITKNGKTAALLNVPEDDLNLERLLLSRSQICKMCCANAARNSSGAKQFHSRRHFVKRN